MLAWPQLRSMWVTKQTDYLGKSGRGIHDRQNSAGSTVILVVLDRFSRSLRLLPLPVYHPLLSWQKSCLIKCSDILASPRISSLIGGPSLLLKSGVASLKNWGQCQIITPKPMGRWRGSTKKSGGFWERSVRIIKVTGRGSSHGQSLLKTLWDTPPLD